MDKALELLRAGIHLLIIDVIPAGSRDPQGIHGAIWENIDEDQPFSLPPGEPLTMVAYTGGLERQAFIEPVAVGKPLPDMPLFLRPPLDTSWFPWRQRIRLHSQVSPNDGGANYSAWSIGY